VEVAFPTNVNSISQGMVLGEQQGGKMCDKSLIDFINRYPPFVTSSVRQWITELPASGAPRRGPI
jgi:hypothetical protein